MMNRAERRQYEKSMRKMGAKNSEAKRLSSMLKENNQLKEGDKVKINYEKITKEPDYDSRLATYKTFIEDNKDKILTVEFDDKKAINGSHFLVQFVEDTSSPKWLFYVDDLIAVEGDNNE